MKNERKLLREKQKREQLQTPPQTATSTSEVPIEVHKSFGPLDMEVILHDTNRSTMKSSTRSRDISPVESPTWVQNTLYGIAEVLRRIWLKYNH